MARIVRLEVENYKRLKALTIDPKGNVVIVGGRNGQGKSSTLDSIQSTLGGAKVGPKKALRNGANTGHSRLVIDDVPIGDHRGRLVVERIYSEYGSQLNVTSDGYEAPTPQALLDALYSKIALDPLEFAREKPAKQSEFLRQIVGLDFTDQDQARKELFDERTSVNRLVKARAAELAACPEVIGVGTEEVSIGDLTNELQRRERQNAANNTRRSEVRSYELDLANQENTLIYKQGELEKLTAQIRELETRIAAIVDRRDKAAAVVANLVDEDPEEIKQQLGAVEADNRKVRQNIKRADLARAVADVQFEASRLTSEIEAIDLAKQEATAAAKFPIDGLGFDEAGITYNGLPFEQASQAERLRVSAAIALAINPELRVLLIRDGSLLDEQSLALLEELAEEHDAQVWIERVGAGSECTVVIEDGVIVGSTGAAEKNGTAKNARNGSAHHEIEV